MSTTEPEQCNGAQHAQHDHGAQDLQGEADESVHRDSWHHGLCGCCATCDLCLLGTFLPCVLLGQTEHRIQEPSMESYTAVNCDCLLMMGITYGTGFGWMYAMRKRFEIRRRYGIKGSDARDCCTSYWCLSSVLVQNEREVMARQKAALVVEGYQMQPEMRVPPAKSGSGA